MCTQSRLFVQPTHNCSLFYLVRRSRQRAGASVGGIGGAKGAVLCSAPHFPHPADGRLCCDLQKMVGPALERGPHVICIFGSVINAMNRSLMSALVVEDSFDVVRLSA